MLKIYLTLTKPGIIFGNAITAAAGFFIASKGLGNVLLLILTLTGLSCVIASACIINNVIDRGIDVKMERTKKRALVEGSIPLWSAISYAIVLGLLGFAILIIFTNVITVGITFIGFFFYVVMYSIWKRRSIYGTMVGSVAGAVPPVIGYCAVSNRVDLAACILFVMLVFWQMPHFYAIAIFRHDDYSAASIPVLPVKKSIAITKMHILFYIFGFILVSLLLTLLGYTGIVYCTIMTITGSGWLILSIKGFWTTNDNKWARTMFFYSLVIIIIFCISIPIDIFLRNILLPVHF